MDGTARGIEMGMIPATAQAAEENLKRILIIEDDLDQCRLLDRTLSNIYQTRFAHTGEIGLAEFRKFEPHIVLIDIGLPGIDGCEVCGRIKESRRNGEFQAIVISATSDPREQMSAFENGADDFLGKPISPQELRMRIQLHLRLLETRTEAEELRSRIQSSNQKFQDLVAARNREKLELEDVAIFTLARVAESRDNETGSHLLRMREYCRILTTELMKSDELGCLIDEEFLSDIYRASPLHDIGKVGIPDAILLKPGKLTTEEFDTMKTHTEIGAEILEEAMIRSKSAKLFEMSVVIAKYHHERWDGTGYPTGLAGDRIPLPARIVAVADVYDALISRRPYKEPWSHAEAIAELRAGAGRHFDPRIIACLDNCELLFDECRAKFADHSPSIMTTRMSPGIMTPALVHW